MKVRQWLFGFTALVILVGTSWVVLISALTWFRSLSPSVAAALTTAVVGLLGLWYAQWQSKSRDIAESHRAAKIEVYSIFFDLVEKFQQDQVKKEDLGEGRVPDWLKKDFARLNRGLILWASPRVITAWLRFRRITSTGSGNIVLAMDQMYAAIRKDLGNSNLGLRVGDLIRIGLKDPDEFKT
jgi:hypothetical protein